MYSLLLFLHKSYIPKPSKLFTIKHSNQQNPNPNVILKIFSSIFGIYDAHVVSLKILCEKHSCKINTRTKSIALNLLGHVFFKIYPCIYVDLRYLYINFNILANMVFLTFVVLVVYLQGDSIKYIHPHKTTLWRILCVYVLQRVGSRFLYELWFE